MTALLLRLTPRRLRTVGLALPIACGVIGASCDHSLSPEAVAGTYALTSPIEIGSWPPLFADTLLADTVELRVDGTGHRWWRQTRSSGIHRSIQDYSQALTYQLEGTFVDITMTPDVYTLSTPPAHRYDYRSGSLRSHRQDRAIYRRIGPGAP